MRYEELCLLKKANEFMSIGKYHHNNKRNNYFGNKVGGSNFIIGFDNNDKMYMSWKDKRNNLKQKHPMEVINYCGSIISTITNNKKDITINGFTEYKVTDKQNENTTIYRAHPSYRSDTTQINNVWYDWAEVNINNKKLPCQLLCFITLPIINADNQCTYNFNDYSLESNVNYVIIRKFKEEPTYLRKSLSKKDDYSSLIKWGELDDSLHIVECNNILSPVAVVPNISNTNIRLKEDDDNERNKKGFWLLVIEIIGLIIFLLLLSRFNKIK